MRNVMTHLFMMIIFIACLLFSGCAQMPVPESTIGPPKVEAAVSSEDEAVATGGFIPEGYDLLTRDNSSGRFALTTEDYDGDGMMEMLIFYGEAHKNKASGMILIESVDDEWLIKWDKSMKTALSYIINDYHVIDFQGSGTKSIILELGYKDHVKMIQIIEFAEEADILYVTECNNLEVIVEEGENPALAIWINVVMDVEYIEVIRWNVEDGAFRQATYDVPDYYSKLVPFYEKNLLDNGVESIYGYYYADILMKAGRYDEALMTVSDYLKGESHSLIYDMKGNFIKGKCAYMIGGDVALAKEALLLSNEFGHYYIDKLMESFELLAYIHLEEGDVTRVQELTEAMTSKLGKFMKSDYKRAMWENRIEQLKTVTIS